MYKSNIIYKLTTILLSLINTILISTQYHLSVIKIKFNEVNNFTLKITLKLTERYEV